MQRARTIATAAVIIGFECLLSAGLFEGCNHLLKLKRGQKIYISSPYYPNSYPSGTSCRYTVEAPTDYQLEFRCDINISSVDGVSCKSEIFYFNKEGSELFSGSDYFCGIGNMTRKSFGSRATISYISFSNSGPKRFGRFSCLVEVVQPDCDCGWNSGAKIAGGTEVSLGEFPFAAAVIHEDENAIFCGATIIHQRYVLSAAHCYVVQETSLPDKIKVVVGEIDFAASKLLDFENGLTQNIVFNPVQDLLYNKRYDIEQIIKHKNFQMTNLRHDVALLKTSKDIEWNRVVAPACLPFHLFKKTLYGHKLDAIGWGTTTFGGQQPNVLLKASLDVLTNGACKRSTGAVTSGQFCTRTPGKDACQYDSGGGLFLTQNRTYLVGIVGYGYECAGKLPSVNTRVSGYLKWVQNKAKGARFCEK